MKKYLSLIIKYCVIASLIIFLVTWGLLKNNPDIAEGATRTVVRGYARVASFLSALIPFMSLTELFVVSTAAVLIFLLVLAIINFCKKRVVKGLNQLFVIPIIVLAVVSAYAFSCEMAYNRQEMPLPYYQEEIQRTEHIAIYNYFVDDLNECVKELKFKENGDLEDMSLKDMSKEIKKAYNIISDDYFHPFLGSVKPMASSFIYRELQIVGVTFAPFEEAIINTLDTNANLPLTIAHELAHTRGVMREEDANKLAFYVCLNSDNPYLRYAAYVGYFYQIEAMVSTYYLTDAERSELHAVSKEFYQTRSYEYKYWKEHDLLGKIGDFFNDLYLKSSGVDNGTDSYAGDTQYDVDPTTHKLIPSLYQKLFFTKYYTK